jgi:hypothetical protein
MTIQSELFAIERDRVATLKALETENLPGSVSWHTPKCGFCGHDLKDHPHGYCDGCLCCCTNYVRVAKAAPGGAEP